MAADDSIDTSNSIVPVELKRFVRRRSLEGIGLVLYGLIAASAVALASWSADDPSLYNATSAKAQNWLGSFGAILADQLMQMLGLAVLGFLAIPLAWAGRLVSHKWHGKQQGKLWHMLVSWLAASLFLAGALASIPAIPGWALTSGLGGNVGDIVGGLSATILTLGLKGTFAWIIVFAVCLTASVVFAMKALSLSIEDTLEKLGLMSATVAAVFAFFAMVATVIRQWKPNFTLPKFLTMPKAQKPKTLNRKPQPAVTEDEEDEEEVDLYAADEEDLAELEEDDPEADDEDEDNATEASDDAIVIVPAAKPKAPSLKPTKPKTKTNFELPELTYLAEPKRAPKGQEISPEMLEENARRLEGVLEDFGVKGQIIKVRPGPVVTLYELEPAPGIKSSRVIGLADDIARSMSAISARVAVVQGRNAIGIELPNAKRETVYLREMFAADNFNGSTQSLCVALGKNIGGEPIFADLARMPHLLIAGTTGSGKSVGINTLILSLLYRLPPDRCKLIMIDPKMLELSVYEGIPHLLAPVVTDPKKAVVALKWAVREMEDRYKKMSKVGVRNVDGYNTRVEQLIAKGEKLTRTVQTGFDAETGKPIFEQEEMETTPMPYIVVIIDEMADLMMVAGKDIEGAVQRLAQMARAAGIHVVMATQRPSVDVITGTIKANFPTRISFQVTSKIDSRTILGEQGAEQLLGQGDMLYMAGGGRISRLHGPFVADGEVETIVNHLKAQGAPDYVEAVTEEADEDEYGDPGAMGGEGGGGSGDDLYDQAVAVVLRDKKVSTSYIQRRLQIGYNKAASLIERMEKEGLISASNATGKREILVPGDSAR
jgi:DNA segregation ATPase FtsK/SpoIIIE, S-DNA-T family